MAAAGVAGSAAGGAVVVDSFSAGVVDAGAVEAGDVEAGDVEAGDVEAGDVEAGVVEAGVSLGGGSAGIDGVSASETPEAATQAVSESANAARRL